MNGNIFICYRRSDDPGTAQALFGRLGTVFSAETVFMDVEGIPAGEDFAELLDAKVRNCDVLLTVIGKEWLEAVDMQGHRRLDDPRDYVRCEIASALDQGKQVIPVLVHGAVMPQEEQLPDPIKRLANRQGVRLSHEQFGSDFRGLVSHLNDAFQKIAERRQAQEEAARVKAEAAEAARRAAAEEQAERERQRILAERLGALTPEQIRKAEELANWDFIKDSTRTEDFRDHLSRFPGGVCERMARAKLEPLVWASLGRAADEPALTAYLAEFPAGAHVQQAQARIDALKPRETPQPPTPKPPTPTPVSVPQRKQSSGILGAIGFVLFMQVVGLAYHRYAYPDEPWSNGLGWPLRSVFQATPPTPKFDFDTKSLGSPNFGEGLKNPLFNQQAPSNTLSR